MLPTSINSASNHRDSVPNFSCILAKSDEKGIKLKLCKNVHSISLNESSVSIAFAQALYLLWQLTFPCPGKTKIGIYIYILSENSIATPDCFAPYLINVARKILDYMFGNGIHSGRILHEKLRGGCSC